MPNSKYRLHSSAFERAEEKHQVDAKRAVFLSVEGDHTERNYFEHLSKCANVVVHIEVLRRKRGSGYSDPQHVIELLKEYIEIREGEVIPEELPEDFSTSFSKEEIKLFLDQSDELPKKKLEEMKREFLKFGIDLEYRKYLREFNNEGDYFAVVFDRDKKSNSRELLVECIKKSKECGYGCYLSNPCFEFWLLLHLCNIKEEYVNRLDQFLENPILSNSHTFTSLQVYQHAGHKKRISAAKFDENYKTRIQNAITHSKEFALSLDDILDELGTNMADLLNVLGF